MDILIQAEDSEIGCNLFQQTGNKRMHFSNKFYNHPCAGLLMGKREVIINFFKDCQTQPPDEWKVADQPAIEWGMKNLDYKIELDTECRIFQQLGMGKYEPHIMSGVNFHLHFNKNFIKNTYTNTYPCIFHASGNSFPNQVWKIINKIY